jgi:hypothetical protein
VGANRERLTRGDGLGVPHRWVWLNQVHGATVLTVRGLPDLGWVPPDADAAVTAGSGVALAVLTADCAPIAIADEVAIGVIHAGWHGLLAGVVPAAVAALRAIGRGPVRAAIGPCIRPPHYEFGRADLDRLVARFGPALEGRTLAGTPALDLAAGVRAAFAECDVTDVDDTGLCTADDPDRFFSFRRDGVTGRQAVVVVKP